jgi:hypothetical protein
MRATTARNINSNKKDSSPEQREELLGALKARFEKNMNRHEGLEWAKVQTKLEANVKRWSQGKNTNQKITPWIWQLPWALSF